MIIILFILIFFINISHEVIYDCNNKIPIRCISDILENDICQYCKCYNNKL